MSVLYGFLGEPNEGLILRLRRSLSHRGIGQVQEEETPFASIGFRADHGSTALAELGSGQFCHPEQDVSITLAGQVLHPRPKHGGILPHLLEQYLERGLEFVDEMRGGFVMAIRDRDEVHLVRDGVGVRSLVWGQHLGRIYFAVESKALLAIPNFPRRLRPGAVAQYLSFSFVPGSGTMLDDIEEMLPGHTLTLKKGAPLKQKRWFFFDDAPGNTHLSDTDWVERVAEATGAAVRERIPQSGSFSTFLSGGLDSSLVLAELCSQGVEHPRSFSIHFGPDYDNELEFAHAVAGRCKSDHTDVEIRPKDFLPRLRQAIWHMDEPIGDPITIPNFELARRVASHSSWVFNGEGGDPLIGGPKNITMMMHHWYGSGDRAPGFRERLYLESYRRAYTELDRLIAPNMLRRIDVKSDLEGILTPFFETDRHQSFLHKLLAINLRLKGAHLILPKVERMLGAWGVTPLSPLFDERLVRLSFAMPGTLKLKGGIEKVVLKQAYRDRLPKAVIDRPKSGMRVPVHHWFRSDLRRMAKRMLSKKRLQRTGIFNPDRVAQLLDYNIEEGPGRYGLRLWMLLTFEIWRSMVIDGESP